jgi:shikimate dehydrogenase
MTTERQAITGRTSVLAILADPVAHAQAPMLVNAALAARGRDAVLVPIHVRADGLARVIDALRTIENFMGAIVTMPHKGTVLPLLDEVMPTARQTGACNVVRRAPDGRLVGTTFDGEAFVAGLKAAGHQVRERRIFLAGAGGAAAAIAFAVAQHGARALTIHNRTRAKAEALATRVRAAWPTLDVRAGSPDPSGHEIAINATSLGMRAGDALPLDVAGLSTGTLAAEIIMVPETTAFLAVAGARGCRVHYGKPMLLAQIDLMIDFMLDDRDRRHTPQ